MPYCGSICVPGAHRTSKACTQRSIKEQLMPPGGRVLKGCPAIPMRCVHTDVHTTVHLVVSIYRLRAGSTMGKPQRPRMGTQRYPRTEHRPHQLASGMPSGRYAWPTRFPHADGCRIQESCGLSGNVRGQLLGACSCGCTSCKITMFKLSICPSGLLEVSPHSESLMSCLACCGDLGGGRSLC